MKRPPGAPRDLYRTRPESSLPRPRPADPDDALLWYGLCTYWTTDWDKLGRTPPTVIDGRSVPGGIPTCPECGAVGFQATLAEWRAGIWAFDRENPGYADWIATLEETCHGPGVTTRALWEQREKEQPS